MTPRRPKPQLIDRDAAYCGAHRAFSLYIAMLVAIAAIMVAALVLLSAAQPARAHSFYHYECCHDRDCWPLAPGAISETPEGWLIVETGDVIPYDWPKIKDSPDGRYHLCTTTGDLTGMKLCFYRPPLSF